MNIARISTLALSYGVSESSAYKTSRWGGDTLIKHPDFSAVARQKTLISSDFGSDLILMDVSKNPIQRPKKNKSVTPGKKKRHTLKFQIVVAREKQKITCTSFCNEKSMILEFSRNLRFASILRLSRLNTLDIRAFKNFMQILRFRKKKQEKTFDEGR